MSKAEEKPVSEYGEPWRTDHIWHVEDADGLTVLSANYSPARQHMDRIVACVNALSGIPNPEAVREVLDAATNWAQTVSLLSTKRNVTEAQSRLYTAVSVMVSSAPSTGAQQK